MFIKDIETYKINNRTKNALIKSWIDTVDKLKNISFSDLILIPSLWRKWIEMINSYVWWNFPDYTLNAVNMAKRQRLWLDIKDDELGDILILIWKYLKQNTLDQLIRGFKKFLENKDD